MLTTITSINKINPISKLEEIEASYNKIKDLAIEFIEPETWGVNIVVNHDPIPPENLMPHPAINLY
jgi:hypothetical protein